MRTAIPVKSHSSITARSVSSDTNFSNKSDDKHSPLATAIASPATPNSTVRSAYLLNDSRPSSEFMTPPRPQVGPSQSADNVHSVYHTFNLPGNREFSEKH